MVNFVGPPMSAVRNRPISDTLKSVLTRAAAAAGIDKIEILSGGQPGTTGHSVGSHRHEGGNAADFKLIKGARVLSFENKEERSAFVAFVRAAAANGATGIGAAVDYMGPETLHVGFGTAAVWGAEGKGVNAPQWLVVAVNDGWTHPGTKTPAPVPQPPPPLPPLTPVDPQADQYVVVARDGAQLRFGPGDEFDLVSTLAVATELTVVAFEGNNKEWALIDLEEDELVDGYVVSTSLAPRNVEEDKHEEFSV